VSHRNFTERFYESPKEFGLRLNSTDPAGWQNGTGAPMAVGGNRAGGKNTSYHYNQNKETLSGLVVRKLNSFQHAKNVALRELIFDRERMKQLAVSTRQEIENGNVTQTVWDMFV
jgi:hypothetical protein